MLSLLHAKLSHQPFCSTSTGLTELLGLTAGPSDGEDEASDEDGSEGAGPHPSDQLDLAELDYDAMLAGDQPGQTRKAGEGRTPVGKSASHALAAVEDEHLKLDEMEAFLQDAERAAAGRWVSVDACACVRVCVGEWGRQQRCLDRIIRGRLQRYGTLTQH